jgi:succinyl-CoA synthetase alpha subunit
MAILVGPDTRLVVQGLTGREGSFHGKRNRDYGTDLVAGVTPGKGGADVDGVPVFDTVTEAVDATEANTAMVFVPPRFAADAILEAHDSGIDVVIAITEGIPAMDMARVVAYLRGSRRESHLIGPNCPGVISPGKANVGIIPGEICSPGPVGLVSRSGTLTYQIVHELSQRGIGQSSCVGIGGDPIPGSDFIDVLAEFETDDETQAVVLVGEIGGDAEERAAAWARANMSTPVVAYIAGFTAPEGKRMGHAGAIVSGSSGTARAKADALESAGIRVGRNPTEVAELAAEALAARP